MKANKLTAGDRFKLKGHRKFITVANSIVIPDLGGKQPKAHIGKILIIDSDCRQWLFDPETEV